MYALHVLMSFIFISYSGYIMSGGGSYLAHFLPSPHMVYGDRDTDTDTEEQQERVDELTHFLPSPMSIVTLVGGNKEEEQQDSNSDGTGSTSSSEDEILELTDTDSDSEIEMLDVDGVSSDESKGGEGAKRSRSPQRALPGAPSLCPICDKEYATAFSVRRHMKAAHGADPSEYGEVASTSRECDWCGKFYSNLPKHRGACKQRMDREASSDDDESDGEAPAAFNSGGEMLLREWNVWIPTQKSVGPTTRVAYTLKLKQLIKHYESSVRRFKMDSLLYPLENEILFPSIDGYLNQAETPGDKKRAVEAYRQGRGVYLRNFKLYCH